MRLDAPRDVYSGRGGGGGVGGGASTRVTSRVQPEAATFMQAMEAGAEGAAPDALAAMSKCVRLSLHMKPAAPPAAGAE